MDHARKTILHLEQRLADLDAESKKVKSAINCLCEVMGEKPKYVLDDQDSQMSPPRPDEYFGRPLATVVTEVLQKRKEFSQGAATADELYSELIAGGFEFVGKTEAIKKRGLAIAMSKNQKFTKLPNESWGLSEWYPEAGRSRTRKVNTLTVTATPHDAVVIGDNDHNEEQAQNNRKKEEEATQTD